jgi:hypothetical protein
MLIFSTTVFFSVYLHDGNLLDGKNQVAECIGILQKIGSRIFNFRIVIVRERKRLGACTKFALTQLLGILFMYEYFRVIDTRPNLNPAQERVAPW